jgi:hypothetical protein
VDREPRDVCILRFVIVSKQRANTVMVNAAPQGRQQGKTLVLRLDRAQNSQHQTPCRHVTQINLNASEPPVQAVPLMRETTNLFGSTPHERTLSHRSPRGRRSRELNQHAGIQAAIRVALHHDADCCLARDNGVDRRAGMARGQGFQPLVTQPVVASARRCLSPPLPQPSLPTTLRCRRSLAIHCWSATAHYLRAARLQPQPLHAWNARAR